MPTEYTNYNMYFIVDKYDYPQYKDSPINSRARLFTGPKCSHKCSFCYYLKQLNQVHSFDTIINRAIVLAEHVDEIELSGGESTEHDDWFKILHHCNLNFKHVSCVTNGQMFSDEDFLIKSKRHGLKEILFSLHGHNDETHDSIVRVPGAFDKIIKAIKNSQKNGLITRINCTVTHLFKGDVYAELINSFENIKQINFLPVNEWDDAQEYKLDYLKASNQIKDAIDTLTVYDFLGEVNVRYIPLCFMIGYIEYVRTLADHIYDLTDWHIGLMEPDEVPHDEINIDDMFDIVQQNREQYYIKTRECTKCKYLYICDGIEKNNIKHNQLTAIPKDIL